MTLIEAALRAPSKLFYSTNHGWKSRGLYTTIGTARNAFSGASGLGSYWGRDGLRNAGQILVAENIEWNVHDDIPEGTTYQKLPWKDQSKVKAARMRARAAALLAEADTLDPKLPAFVPAGEMSHEAFKKLMNQ